jgi:hypothetical protein
MHYYFYYYRYFTLKENQSALPFGGFRRLQTISAAIPNAKHPTVSIQAYPCG